MTPEECLAGMDGEAIAAIQSAEELEVLGMSKEDAKYYFAAFQYFKKHNVPIELIQSNKNINNEEHNNIQTTKNK